MELLSYAELSLRQKQYLQDLALELTQDVKDWATKEWLFTALVSHMRREAPKIHEAAIHRVIREMTREPRYVDAGGTQCPFCRSEDILKDETIFGDGQGTREVQCGKCQRRWLDVYALTGMVEVFYSTPEKD